MATPRERDEGLRRVGRVTRWVTAGAVGVAGVFSLAAAKAVPGRSSTRVTSGQTPAAGTGATDATTPADAASNNDGNGTSTTVDPNAAVAPLAPPPVDLGGGGGAGSVVSGGS